MVAVSDIEGRLRIRDELLKSPSVVEAVRQVLAAFPEVYEIKTNVRSGSLLVRYHHSAGVRDRIMSSIGLHLRRNKSGLASMAQTKRSMRSILPVTTRSRRRLVNFGMMSSLALSLLGAALDCKRVHVVSGALFIVVLGVHLSNKRRLLFA